jgi:DNA-binding beta-propeller fold protein YncE
MSRLVGIGKRARTWTVAGAAVVLLAAGGGVAAAGMSRSDGEVAKATQGMGKTSAAAKGGGTAKTPPGKKPKPSTSPTATPTATPTAAPTTAPPVNGTDVQIHMPGYEPYNYSGDVVVDAAHGRVYLTAGKNTKDVVATDLDGGNPRKIAEVDGGAGMTLSPDGSKLYVAASAGSWVSVIDTSTYETTGLWIGKTDGTNTCPRDVALAAGQLWVAWGCDNAPAGVGRIDLETRRYELNVTVGDGSVRNLVSSPSLLATVPGQPNVLIVGETDSLPAPLYRFEIEDNLLVLKAVGTTDGGPVAQMAVTPDGSEIIIPSGAPYYHQVFRTSDLTLAGKYQTTTYPNAVAIRDDGLVVAGVNGSYEEDLWVFEPGGTEPIITYEFGHLPNETTWAYHLEDGALAVHGNRIYALTDQLSEPETLTLRIRELPE